MACPVCAQRKARRMCPALGEKICAVCCGTKRLVEIKCPKDCVYLVSAREHPSAAAVRQQQRDLGAIVRFMTDLNDRQSRLFFLILTFLVRYEPPELHPLIDIDVAEALAALAATLETSARGVIYEHRPPSMAAERLMGALKPVLAEAGQRAGTGFEREAAAVLRRIEAAAREASTPRSLALSPPSLDKLGTTLSPAERPKGEAATVSLVERSKGESASVDPGGRRRFVELVGRVLRETGNLARDDHPSEEGPRVIIP